MGKSEAHPVWLWLAVACGIVIIVLFVTFGPHLHVGGPAPTRSVGGVALRSLVWIVLAFAAYRALGRPRHPVNEQDTF